MSCNNKKEYYTDNDWLEDELDAINNIQELDDICYEIKERIFQDNQFIFDNVNLHRTYLNSIDSKHPFCTKMQQAYEHCSFCTSKSSWDCKDFALNCYDIDNMPTKQEILAKDTTNELYSWVTSQQDIDEICDAVEHIHSSRPLEALYRPYSIPLCERRSLVLHLCPGYCDQSSCFEQDNLPSCDIPAMASAVPTVVGDAALPVEDVCEDLRRTAFQNLGYQDIFNLDLHQNYLTRIPWYHPMCNEFQEAYPHCFWCKSPDVQCFSEERRPSCDAVPIDDKEEENNLVSFNDDYDHNDDDNGFSNVGRICKDIAHRLGVELWEFRDIIDLSLDLHLMANTTTCSEAKRAYHQCVWCDIEAQDYAAQLREEEEVQVEDDVDTCRTNLIAPDYIKNNILKMNNISGGVPTEEDCAKLSGWWIEREHVYTLEGMYETVAMENLCPRIFCPPRPEELDLPAAPELVSMNYLGTSSDTQRKALIWASRFSAFLSFIGAFFILVDVLSNPNTRTTVYHQILIGMALFDLITAIAWGFATAPIASDQNVEGCKGTEATCIAQAFFIQLGFTSVFYNVSLSIYYMLVIVYSWREFQLKKISPYLHAVPITIGLGLAFGGIPIYSMLEYGCHLEPHTKGKPIWQVVVFVVLPLGVSILFITGSMLVVYLSVRKQALKATKWQQTGGGSRRSSIGNMEEAVFWQCASYVLAFYITWPIMFCVYLFSVDAKGPFGFALTVAFVAPLQGFSNFICYLRTKLKNHRNRGKALDCNVQFFRRLLGNLLPKISKDSQHASGEDNNVDPVLSEMDPSAALQLYRDKISSEMPSSLCSVRQGQNQVEVTVTASKDRGGSSSLTNSVDQTDVTVRATSNDEGGSVAAASLTNRVPGVVLEEGNHVLVSGGKEDELVEKNTEIDLGESIETQGHALQVVANPAPDCFQSNQEIDIEDPCIPTFDGELGEVMSGQPTSAQVSIKNHLHHHQHDVNLQEPLYPRDTSGQQKDWRKYLLQGSPT